MLKKIQNYLYICVLILFSVSCSQKTSNENMTKVNFSLARSGDALLADGDGGIMVWGSSPSGSFGRSLTPGGSVGLTLPNGSWTFYAMSWDGANEITGTVKCGEISEVLSGEDTNVDITLNLTNCGSGNFSPFNSSGTTTNFISAFESCSDISVVSSPVTGACDYALATERRKGYAVAYQIQLMEFDDFEDGAGVIGPALESACLSVETTSSSSLDTSALSSELASNLKLPFGGGSVPVYTRVVGYYGQKGATVCDGVGGQFEIDYEFGLAADDNPFGVVNDNSGNLELWMEVDNSEMCLEADHFSTTTFAAGDGQAVPFFLCNEDQFNLVGGSTNWASGDVHSDKDFELGADLDFGANNTSLGYNFIPWGEDFGVSAATSFTGNFIGNGYTLRNLFYDYAATDAAGGVEDNLGLIRSLGDGVYISDFTIENMIIFCDDDSTTTTNCQNVGSVAGQAFTTGVSTAITNITVNGALIEGGPVTGGIIGYADDVALLADLDFYGSVRSEFGTADTVIAGGIVGKVDALTAPIKLERLYVNAEIETNDSNAGVGGLVGAFQAANGTSFVYTSLVEGTFEAKQNIGGFIGNVTGGQNLSILSNYSKAYINATIDAGTSAIGGVIGEDLNSGAIVIDQFFNLKGAVVNSAAGTGMDQIVGIQDGTPPTCNNEVFSAVYTVGASPADNCVATIGSPATALLDDGAFPASWFSTLDADSNGEIDFYYTAADDTFDHPRLSWENPSLCTGFFATAVSNGFICSPGDFLSAASLGGSFNVLEDLDFQEEIASTFNGDTDAFIDTLDSQIFGNQFRFFNLEIGTGSFNNRAIINEITSTGVLSGIQFSGVLVSDSGTNAANDVEMAGLALINDGFIEEVLIGGGLAFTNAYTSADNLIDRAALVMENNGTIQNVVSFMDILDVSTRTVTTNFPSVSTSMLVGTNSGTGEILDSRVQGEYEKTGAAGAAVAANSFPGSEFGGIALVNDGIIRRVNTETRVELEHATGSEKGEIDFGGIVHTNNNTISDIYFSFELNNSGFLENGQSFGMMSVTNNGSFDRIVIDERGTNTIQGTGHTFTLNPVSNSGSVGDLICSVPDSGTIDTLSTDGNSGAGGDPCLDSNDGTLAGTLSGGTFTYGDTNNSFGPFSESTWDITEDEFSLLTDPNTLFTWTFYDDEVPELAPTQGEVSFFFPTVIFP